jgi:hypothetical protein
MSGFKQFVTRAGVRADVREGAQSTPPWAKDMNDYRVTLHYQGRRITTDFFTGSAWTHPPHAADVLSSLISDAQSFEYETPDFESWADSMGHDPDSREAYATWKKLEALTPRVHRFLGNDFEEFAEAARDY